MSETFTDTPSFLIAATVFNDGYVSRLTCRRTVIVGLEWIVSLINDQVDCRISVEFSNFNELNI